MSRKPDPDSDTPYVDFVGGAVGHRHRFGGGRGQALPKAAGLKSGHTPHVVDATAGLGRDAFLLASLGCHVTLIERSETLYAALASGIERALKSAETREIAKKMTLMQGDSILLLQEMTPDVILVDPMHPPRKGSALVKKEMRQIRQIVGPDLDSAELLQVALKSARQRVVLKWPARGEPLQGVRPASHQIIGKSTRYDVFICG